MKKLLVFVIVLISFGVVQQAANAAYGNKITVANGSTVPSGWVSLVFFLAGSGSLKI